MVMVRLSMISQNGVMSRTLNVSKTKAMIDDFRKRKRTRGEIQIHGETVEIVHSYKYLGKHFEATLKWDLNTEAITRKRHQLLHLLRKLRSFNVDPTILKLFYNSYFFLYYLVL